MSWYCQMVDGKRRCMDFGEYQLHGWVLDKSFAVEEKMGVFTRKKGKKYQVKPVEKDEQYV